MQIKLFEIRDSMTFLPVVAIHFVRGEGNLEAENYLLRSVGYSTN